MNVERLGWSIRAKGMLASALCCVGVFLGFWLTRMVDQRLFPLCFLSAAGFMWFRYRLRCPKCGKPVYRTQAQVLGVRFTGWNWGLLAFPRKCSHCDLDFSQAINRLTPAGRRGRQAPRSFQFPDEGWRAASPRKKRIMLGVWLGAGLLGSAWAYLQHNSFLLIWGLIGSAVLAGLLLAVRDE